MAYYLQQTADALAFPLFTLWDSLIPIILGAIGALIVIVVGFVISAVFGFVVEKIIEHSKIDEQIRKRNMAHSIGYISLSKLSGGLVHWYIFALFLVQAASLMSLGVLSDLLAQFATWLPNLIAGIVVLVVGVMIADYFGDKLLHAKRPGARALSGIVRWAMIFFVAMIVLQQIGINVSLATNTTLIVVTAIAVSLAIAIGISFGFAFKEEAKTVIKNVKKNF